MWYFTWVLGLGFACTFAVLNAMWLELQEVRQSVRAPSYRD
jgi:cytochrome bd-I ubiquinol oxidase subunit X